MKTYSGSRRSGRTTRLVKDALNICCKEGKDVLIFAGNQAEVSRICKMLLQLDSESLLQAYANANEDRILSYNGKSITVKNAKSAYNLYGIPWYTYQKGSVLIDHYCFDSLTWGEGKTLEDLLLRVAADE